MGGMSEFVGMGMIEELGRLQREYNAWTQNATPEERAQDAKRLLRYIGETEEDAPDWYREIEP